VPAEYGEYRIQPFSRSAREVGGDFYDFVQLDGGRLMFVIGDASGKGVPACMLMAMCQSFVRSSAQRFQGLEVFLEQLNRYLFHDTDRGHFVTLAVCIIDVENHICEYARAGHTELLLRLASGVTRVIKPDGPSLGLLPDELGVHFDTLSFRFKPGTSLMLFTDGITEALDEDENEFGIERLEQIWRTTDGSPEEVSKRVLSAVEEFKGDAPQADDQTILVISRPEAAVPAAEPEANT
jgi:serine phosphatase RsbU (regulator of sigma subunit)